MNHQPDPIRALNDRLAAAEEAGPVDVLADAVELLREAATLYDARDQPESAGLLRRLARELTPAAASSAGVAPAPDQTALRDRIAEALYLHEWPRKQVWAQALAMDRETFLAQADAVLSVLPASVDRADAEAPAAECSAQHRQFDDGRLCIRAAQHHGDHIDERGFHWSDTVAVYPLADGTFRSGIAARHLRRVAAETHNTTEEQAAVTVHAIPLPGSNGISACCGRPPCEFVGERLTRDLAAVTCPGPAGGAAQPICKCPAEICQCGHHQAPQPKKEA